MRFVNSRKRCGSLFVKKEIEILKQFFACFACYDLGRKEGSLSTFYQVNDFALSSFKNLFMNSESRLEPAPLRPSTFTFQSAKLFSNATEPRVKFPLTERALAKRGMLIEN